MNFVGLLMRIALACALVIPLVDCRSRAAHPVTTGNAMHSGAAGGSAIEHAPTIPMNAAAESERRIAYEAAMAQAKGWLDTLRVDPLELRSHGIKGKKKLVELLDAYYRLVQVAAPDEKENLLQKIRGVVSVTYDDRYHDMLSIDDESFKQDSTSYLRAAVLMDRLGLDTTRYRREILKINERLNAQMSLRGAQQRRIFHNYYQHFGLTEPYPLETALKEGLIAGRRSPAGMSVLEVYDLTHEIYALYEYGDRLDVDPFTAADKEYIRKALQFLIRRSMSGKDPDLVGELLECEHYVRMQEDPTYLQAINFLLTDQNPDGSWGSYPRERQRLGDYVRQGYELHTTLVAIGSLTAVFDKPMPPETSQ